MAVPMHNIGEALAIGVPSIFPLVAPAQGDDLKGTGLDRTVMLGIEHSCVLYVAQSIGGSAKTNVSRYKIQHSVDNTDGNYSDYTDPSTGAVAAITLTGSATVITSGKLNVDLGAAKRWIRVMSLNTDNTITSACTSVPLAIIIRGGAQELPAGVASAQ